MYASPSPIHNGHNPPPPVPSIPVQVHQNGQHNRAATHRSNNSAAPKERITVVGIPSVSIQDNHLVVGSSDSNSTRSYTPLKVLGDGSFGTVWLCDWHGTLPPNTPLSPMQCGAGARPEWAGKRLVAVKRMKKKWEGGWDECRKLKELESLRAIPFHPNIIPLYDFFLLPASKELYFVFESMEGNLYHLIKARKGRALAGGLVASIFRQIVLGLDHIHTEGYFHRDMKPENVLVTTTGLFDYTSVSPLALPNAPKEKDVVAIIKLADFGLARETKSKPPYTEYVSTRWYRAPEVLLLSRDYSNPVDMWALGTIMAELVNLRPLFPGSDHIDQVARICEILGDPSDSYGSDSHNNLIGGGPWSAGISMAKAVGFQFPKIQPKDIHSLFERTVPISLILCIQELLRYDPNVRLTSRQCLQHPYLLEIASRNVIPLPSGLLSTTSLPASSHQNGTSSRTAVSSHLSLPQPHLHPNNSLLHPSHIPEGSASHRSPYYPSSVPSHTPSPSQHSSEYGFTLASSISHDRYDRPAMASSIWGESNGASASSHVPPTDYPMDTSVSEGNQQPYTNGQDYSQRARPDAEGIRDAPNHPNGVPPAPSGKLGKFSSLGFGKKHSKWGLGMFGGDKSHPAGLPPLEEVPIPTSLKRTQSSSTDSKSVRELSPVQESPVRNPGDVKKNNKKEAERLQREAEKQRRKLAEKMHREQARAVIQKRNQMMQKTVGNDIEWLGGNEQRLGFSELLKGKESSSGPIRQTQKTTPNAGGSSTLGAASGIFVSQADVSTTSEWRGSERISKARRREFDDDHSMSSSEVHSGRMSSISFATVDSDPGPSRIRNRPSLFSISRMTSMSSLRTSFDDFAPSARSSNSFSLEGQLIHDFRTQASVTSRNLAGSVSPPPMQSLSLSPSASPSLSPSPPWIQIQHPKDGISPRRQQSPTYISQLNPNMAYSPFEFGGTLQSPYGHPSSPFGHPPSPGHAPKSAINPIFKVPPLPPPTGDSLCSPTALPPFSQLEAVAGGEYEPLSPMAFHTPSEEI